MLAMTVAAEDRTMAAFILRERIRSIEVVRDDRRTSLPTDGNQTVRGEAYGRW
jgi:hypothetical protein